MGKTLDNYPTWSQNADPSPDGPPDLFATTDCGWECCSIIIYGLTRVYTTEGTLRKEDSTAVDHGYTSPGQLVQCLTRHAITAQQLVVAPSRLKSLVKEYIDAGYPALALGHWIDPNILHWLVAVGYGNDHLLWLDVWSGKMVCSRWTWAEAFFAGSVVGVYSHRTKV